MKNRCIIVLLLLSMGSLRGQTTALFNGKDLEGWKNAELDTNATIRVLGDGSIECGAGSPMNGILYTNEPPRMNYEIALKAMRVKGGDFFAALTFPIEQHCCTVIIGGWGGGLCGISSIDCMDASENQWSEGVALENERWYLLRVRVTPNVLQVFLDETLYQARVEFERASLFSLRAGSDIDKTAPLGLATYCTQARWRDITVTRIENPLPDDHPKEL